MQNKLDSIKLFKGVLREDSNGFTIDTRKTSLLIDKALSYGVEIEPQVFNGLTYTESVELTNRLISMYGVDLAKTNSTFYKTFEETRETPEFIRFIHQLIHYASTYGGFDELKNSGEIFEPSVINEENWDSLIKFTKSFIKIKTFDLETMVDKVSSLVVSGLALSEEDLDFVFNFIVKHWKEFNKENDFIDKVKNRELLAKIALAKNVVPRNFDELMRVIFLAVIDSSVVINNKKSKILFKNASHEKIAEGATLFETYVKNYGEVEASKHVTRYRDFIMLLKLDHNKSMINKVLKLSKKNYQPRKEDPLSTITSNKVSVHEVEKILNNSFEHGTLTIYRLVRLINATRKTLAAGTDKFKDAIKIRNGKIHVRDERQLSKAEIEKLRQKELVLTSFVSKLIGDKIDKKVFVFDETFVPVVPTSGKTFIGFLPEYSYFKLGKERGVVGVAWQQSADLDLHGTTVSGNYGWNTSYSNSGVTYTGDMTHLNRLGFAAEYYESKLDEGELLKVSVSPYFFSGEYQIIIASGKASSHKVHSAKSINESIDDIIYVDTRTSDGNDTEQLFTIVKIDGQYRAVVMDGSNIGGHVIDHEATRATLDSNRRALKSMLTMEELLRLAGAEVMVLKDTSNKSVIENLSSDYPDLLNDEEELKVIKMDAKNMTKELFTSIFNETDEVVDK